MKECMNEKNSFILYCNYEEQLNMLNDEQVGQLFRGVFAYMRTGEQHSSDPMVTMLLSVICHQLDVDSRKYEETKERRKEAGRKGGLQKAENKMKNKKGSKSSKASNATNASEVVEMAGLHDTTEQDVWSAASNTKQSLANLADNVNVNENEYVNENVDVNVNDYIFSDDGIGYVDEEEEYACGHELIYYTDNGYPTIQAELDKCSEFTDKLFRIYWNRKPSQYDMAQVFDYVQGRGYLPDGTGYAAVDVDKAELLMYVFKLAANNDSPKWKYVDGVYKRFREREIYTLYDAQRYDWELEHGKGVLV